MTDTPRALVEEFFERMADDERRHTVGDCFAENAVITLPGARFEGPGAADEMLEWLAPRYERAAKEYADWIEAGPVVVSQGTLFGVDADGERFEDVRYVDVYRIEDGEIARLDIYNDLAAEGVIE
ncbi:nuclear transport factor 2 family protein [Natrinema versiforme]|uniref:Nuclear transport factor 2 family protein n=1 Tax=Natrinema versiforme TaxID=88724 RepID=A0A4P8WSN7_9EURY|nr:nuclear transport factor 2 family protein [Natrinema versiforme]QCS45061.1 nuclear transport factor 2 family protein [Natrinema versiforme]